MAAYSQQDASLYLSIDKEYGTVTDTDGRDISKIEGAYEQKPLSSELDGSFSASKAMSCQKETSSLPQIYRKENPLRESLLEKEAACNTENKLSGTLQAEMISNAADNKLVSITAEFLEKEKTAAIYPRSRQHCCFHQ